MIIKHFFSKHQPTNTEAAFDSLSRLEMLDLNKATSWKCFVQVHLQRNDIPMAVKAFEEIALNQRVLPYKYKLMEELIQRDELDHVQKVLDISIRVSGEEQTLYSAMYSFLCLGKTRNVQKLLGRIQVLHLRCTSIWLQSFISKN